MKHLLKELLPNKKDTVEFFKLVFQILVMTIISWILGFLAFLISTSLTKFLFQ